MLVSTCVCAASGEVNWKADSQYGKQKTTEAVSAFAKSRNIKEQRQYLPIYTCRAQLMQIIADNTIVVIVGETGRTKISFRFLSSILFCGVSAFFVCLRFWYACLIQRASSERTPPHTKRHTKMSSTTPLLFCIVWGFLKC